MSKKDQGYYFIVNLPKGKCLAQVITKQGYADAKAILMKHGYDLFEYLYSVPQHLLITDNKHDSWSDEYNIIIADRPDGVLGRLLDSVGEVLENKRFEIEVLEKGQNNDG